MTPDEQVRAVTLHCRANCSACWLERHSGEARADLSTFDALAHSALGGTDA